MREIAAFGRDRRPGWAQYSLLSGRRTALVVIKQADELVPLHNKADADKRAGRPPLMGPLPAVPATEISLTADHRPTPETC